MTCNVNDDAGRARGRRRAAPTAGMILAHARESRRAVDRRRRAAAEARAAPGASRSSTTTSRSLPGRTFVRGFVRNYARLLKLDVDARARRAAGRARRRIARPPALRADVARDGRDADASAPRGRASRAGRSRSCWSRSSRSPRTTSSRARRRARPVPRPPPSPRRAPAARDPCASRPSLRPRRDAAQPPASPRRRPAHRCPHRRADVRPRRRRRARRRRRPTPARDQLALRSAARRGSRCAIARATSCCR